MRASLPWFSRNAIALSAVALSVGVLAACTSSGSSSSSSSTSPSASASSSANTTPISIGASLSLTGDFSADGQAFQKGYTLWAKDVNAAGGIMGRQVKLTILNDASSPNQVVTNYQTLINTDHVDLTFGPFSSLLTGPASAVAARSGYAFIEGAGGAPAVFQTPQNEADHNVFDVSLPVADELMPFVNYIASLPASQRPKTAAYPMAQDPFADPPVQQAQQKLQALGVKTVYSNIFPAEPSSYTPQADNVAAKAPDVVVLGSTDVPTVQAFMKAFETNHYTPKWFVAAAGPDQGAAFITAVGAGNADGMMVPNGWYPGYANAASAKMVSEYVAQVRRQRVRRERGRGRGLLGGPGGGAGHHGHRRHRQLQDHRLPAQRRHAEHRAGPGEVRLPRRERPGGGLRLPVAGQRDQVRPGSAAGSDGQHRNHQEVAVGLGLTERQG